MTPHSSSTAACLRDVTDADRSLLVSLARIEADWSPDNEEVNQGRAELTVTQFRMDHAAALEANLWITFEEMLDQATMKRIGVSKDRPIGQCLVRVLAELRDVQEQVARLRATLTSIRDCRYDQDDEYRMRHWAGEALKGEVAP